MGLELQIYLFFSILIWFQVSALLLQADRMRSGRIDLLNPGFIFATLYLLYSDLVFLDPETWEANGATEFAYASMIGFLGILLGTMLAYTKVVSRRDPQSPVIPTRALLYWGLLLAAVSTAMLFVMFVRHLGVYGLYQADAFERASATYGILSGFNFLLPIGVGFSLPALYLRGGAFRLPVAAAIVVVLGVLFLVSASRSEILYSCTISMFVYHRCIKRIPTSTILAISFCLLLILVITGIIRGRSGQGIDMVKEAVTRESVISHMGVSRLEPFKCGVNSMELIHDGPPGGKYLWGASLLYFVPYLVPSAIAKLDRPQLLDAWYMENYAPDVAVKGGGLGFSPLVDAYFNFGAAGCVIYFFLFSFLLNRLHVEAMRTAPFSRLRLVNCLVATSLIMMNRISISGYVKNFLYVFVLTGFLFLSWCLLFRERPAPDEGGT